MKSYQSIQEEESATWLIEDPIKRKEKAQRELIRYPLLLKQMGLNHLDTSNMTVWDIGAGPLQGVSQLLNCKTRLPVDPLKQEYAKYFQVDNYLGVKAEELESKLIEPDLIIVTNALDHFEAPGKFILDLVKYTKPSCYVAMFHAIDNAYSHPHDAHQWNINWEFVWSFLKNDFEVVWYMDYKNDGLTYGWLKQPAFSFLIRRTTGYAK